jgi:hypothetical protein
LVTKHVDLDYLIGLDAKLRSEGVAFFIAYAIIWPSGLQKQE